MDRFIGNCWGLSNRWKDYLKSNMDRFIEAKLLLLLIDLKHLKSNMDRFIEIQNNYWQPTIMDLKSNMDRFIGVKSCVFDFHSEFKIQYG